MQNGCIDNRKKTNLKIKIFTRQRMTFIMRNIYINLSRKYHNTDIQIPNQNFTKHGKSTHRIGETDNCIIIVADFNTG